MIKKIRRATQQDADKPLEYIALENIRCGDLCVLEETESTKPRLLKVNSLIATILLFGFLCYLVYLLILS